MGVHVDEAGGQHETRRVDPLAGGRAGRHVDGRNAPVADGHRRDPRRGARAVDEAGALDHEIVRRRLRRAAEHASDHERRGDRDASDRCAHAYLRDPVRALTMTPTMVTTTAPTTLCQRNAMSV